MLFFINKQFEVLKADAVKPCKKHTNVERSRYNEGKGYCAIGADRKKNIANIGSLKLKMHIFLSHFRYKKVYVATEGMLVYIGMCFFIP